MAVWLSLCDFANDGLLGLDIALFQEKGLVVKCIL